MAMQLNVSIHSRPNHDTQGGTVFFQWYVGLSLYSYLHCAFQYAYCELTIKISLTELDKFTSRPMKILSFFADGLLEYVERSV